MKPEAGFQISGFLISEPEVERPLGSDSEAEGGLRRRRRRIRSPSVADSWVAVLGIANGVAERDALLCRGNPDSDSSSRSKRQRFA